MNHVRGYVMLLAAGFAVWKGWMIHSGPHAWMAYGLAAAALALAAWHLTRGTKGLRD
jgi:choline-glycine betaine transporter